MPHPRHRRAREARHRAHQRFVVERPQVLGRAASARDDHHVEVVKLCEPVERSDDRLDRSDALDRCGREDELHAWIAPRDDRLDVVPDRADGARHDADASRCGRERAFSLEREESLGRQSLLQRLEPQVGVARAGRAQVIDADLAASVDAIELDPAVHE